MNNAKQRKGSGRWAVDCLALCLSTCALFTAPLYAQGLGVSTGGSTGGLVIPSAEVLPLGTMALSYGNFEEPLVGVFSTHRNYSWGIGLLPRVELFGRMTDYSTPVPGSIVDAGGRDLSPNLKLQLPTPWPRGPKVAVGLYDFAGGSSPFTSDYLVASDQYGPLSVSVGYARRRRPTAFDGAFGGVELRLGDSGLSVLAEHDGQQNHAGLRWHSKPITALGQAQVVGSLHRSFNAVTPAGESEADQGEDGKMRGAHRTWVRISVSLQGAYNILTT